MELHRFFRYAIEKMCKEKKSLNHFNISNLHFLINNTRLLYSDSDHSLYNNENKPLYFNDVYIEYQSIVKETDGSFTMLVKLSSVNGRILDEIIPIKRFLLSSDLNN